MVSSIILVISAMYLIIIGYTIFSFVSNKPIGKLPYYLTAYSFGLLFFLRTLSLISVNSKYVNIFGLRLPITNSIAQTDVFNFLDKVCNVNNTIVIQFFVAIVLYIITLFVIKMTSNINALKIKTLIYCGLLVFLVGSSHKSDNSTEMYITLFAISIVLYLVSVFGRNMFKNFKSGISESTRLLNKKRENKHNQEKNREEIEVFSTELNKKSKINGEIYEEGDYN